MLTKGVSDRRVYKADQSIFREGEDGYEAFLIIAGEVAITKLTNDGRTVLATVKKNEIFGEMALIDGSPRMANAEAVTNTTCTVINQYQFDNKLKSLNKDIRTVFDFLIRFTRDTLPYDLRIKSGQTKETKFDETARNILKMTNVSETLKKEDLFLKALFEILISYAVRRLPPKSKSAIPNDDDDVWEIE